MRDRVSVAVAVVGVAVLVLMLAVGLSLFRVADYNHRVTSALDTAAYNDKSDNSALQQQVVNGWLARDLALIEIRQRDDETVLLAGLAALLALVLAGVAVLVVQALSRPRAWSTPSSAGSPTP